MNKIDEFKALYWLSLTGLSSRRLNAVLSKENAVDIFEGFCANLKNETIFKNHFENAAKLRNIDLIESKLFNLNQSGVNVLSIKDAKYPVSLAQNEVSPPIILYYKGNLDAINNICVGIVGTRSNTQYGGEVAQHFARELALNGVTVVSGLASGIDEHAHKAALETGLTAAVLGSGISKVTAYSVSLLNKIISNNGVVVSEYPPEAGATKFTFPERNRIISGLSAAIVVVEAPLKSGALITADYALDQGRDVYAVPKGIHDAKSAGCNELIKHSRAQLATCPDDILNNLNLKLVRSSKKERQISLDIFEQKIYNLLSDGQLHFNALMEECGFASSEVLAVLMRLELKGLIKRLAGNYYKLAL